MHLILFDYILDLVSEPDPRTRKEGLVPRLYLTLLDSSLALLDSS